MALLEINNLHTYFRTKRGIVKAVNGVSYSLERGRTLGIVGESGSGKSVSAMSIIKLLDGNGYIAEGSIRYQGEELTRYTEKQMNRIRGNEISVIFQEPMTSLNPVLTIGRQMEEPLILHQHSSRREAKEKAVSLLASVNIPNPEAVAAGYAHQLSGGMRQRVMIAMALACNPSILIADEPTTALDVTIQAQILKLMNEMKEKHQTAILFITHDLGVMKKMADEIAVMYCGQVVEQASKEMLFGSSQYRHPYTEGLMASIPRLNTPLGVRLPAIPGAVPHPLCLPQGCKFAGRCPYVQDVCLESEPKLKEVEAEHFIRCHFPNQKERQKKEDRS